ncbi:hypothetical protein V8B97DRAFT_1874377 [Scleroderma yunnanense]
MPTSPSAQEIWKWTLTKDAIAPCFIRDVLSMKESGVKEVDFFWLGYTPCRSVLIVAMVVAVQVYEKRTVYTLDDGTEVIDCILRHSAPAKQDSSNTGASPNKPRLSANSADLPAPPPPVAEHGYPVRVVGKVVRHYDSRQIIAESIEPCLSALDEATHWLRVIELHKSKYSLAVPFVIPPSTSIGRFHEVPPAEDANVFATSGKTLDSLQSYELAPPRAPPQKRAYHPSSARITSNIPSGGPSRAPMSPPSSIVSSTPSSPIKGSSPTKDSYPLSKPKLRHPSRLHSRDLTSNTFRLYLKHYMDNASPDPSSNIDLSERRLGLQGHSEDKTPTKQRVDLGEQTPRPSSCVNMSNESGSHAVLKPPPTLGFTLSHLRRVPELALLASRVVRAEARRRAKAEKAETSDRAKTLTGSASRSVPFLNASNSVRTLSSRQNIPADDPPCAKMKRLFGWALVRLYEEGSIVLWDGPVHPLPVSLSVTDNSLWSAGGSSTVLSASFVSASASLFSGAATSGAQQSDDTNGYLSDPQPNEESYVSLTPELLSPYVRDAVIALKRGKGRERGTGAGGSASRAEPTPEAIVAYLHRTDARWARVGMWAVEEALEIFHT